MTEKGVLSGIIVLQKQRALPNNIWVVGNSKIKFEASLWD